MPEDKSTKQEKEVRFGLYFWHREIRKELLLGSEKIVAPTFIVALPFRAGDKEEDENNCPDL